MTGRAVPRLLPSALLFGAAAAVGFAAFSLTSTSLTDSARAQDADRNVLTMDLDFLREKLLKIWVIEEASDRHNQKRIAQKSFQGMTPLEPTGDAAIDAENRAAYLKNDKHLRHYLTLEYDNAIEAIDICKHVLGTHLRPPQTDEAIEAFLDQELPEIKWSGKPLDAALKDLGRKIGVQVEFTGIADNETVDIDLQLDAGFQLRQAIEFIHNIHPIEWKYEGGRWIVRYIGSE